MAQLLLRLIYLLCHLVEAGGKTPHLSRALQGDFLVIMPLGNSARCFSYVMDWPVHRAGKYGGDDEGKGQGNKSGNEEGAEEARHDGDSPGAQHRNHQSFNALRFSGTVRADKGIGGVNINLAVCGGEFTLYWFGNTLWNITWGYLKCRPGAGLPRRELPQNIALAVRKQDIDLVLLRLLRQIIKYIGH